MRGIGVYIKHMKKNEYEKLEAVQNIPELKQIALPFMLFHNIEVMPCGQKLHYNERPDLKKLIPKLKKLYELRIKNYSEGIYSFARCGINKREQEQYYYRYIENEILSLIKGTRVSENLKNVFIISKKLWDIAIEKYRDKYFYKYEILHGDLHEGNILYWWKNIYLIDWEYLRSGPKEMELSFFLCWHYLQKSSEYSNFELLDKEIEIMKDENLIDNEIANRIKELLIPMWFIVDICYLSNGNLAFAKEREAKIIEIVPRYLKYLNGK